MDELDAILTANDVVAVLGRDVPLRLKNLSASGCLFETSNRVDAATTGTIRIVVDGETYEEDIRVMWCRACEGASALYRVGAQFFWTSSPGEHSLRRVLAKANSGARIQQESIESDVLWTARHRPS